MPRLETAIAGALSLLLLSACGSREPAAAQNGAVAAPETEAFATDNGAAGPAQPADPANEAGEPVPPPDAVSHPNGYLPPAPAEGQTPLANSTDADKAPPATEDQYIRNGQ